MSEFAVIYVLLVVFAISIASFIVIQIRDNKNILEKQEEQDFITKFINKKTEMLKINMPSISIKTYIAMSVICPIVFGVLLWIAIPNKLFAVMLALFSAFLPDVVIKLIVENKKKKYEERYVKALKAFASSLKAGMSIQQSIQDVSNNIFVSDDLREAFRQLDADIRVGISIQDAFNEFAEKADHDDARDVAAAISLQTDVGGSEGKVIESISRNIEDRLVTRKKIRSVFAATDYLVKFMDFIPFIVVILVCIGMPEYVEPIMNNPIHMVIVIGILAFTVYGSYAIKKKIRNTKGE